LPDVLALAALAAHLVHALRGRRVHDDCADAGASARHMSSLGMTTIRSSS
jgi:hypothetical protein